MYSGKGGTDETRDNTDQLGTSKSCSEVGATPPGWVESDLLGNIPSLTLINAAQQHLLCGDMNDDMTMLVLLLLFQLVLPDVPPLSSLLLLSLPGHCSSTPSSNI
jgi:hypothetical protein